MMLSIAIMIASTAAALCLYIIMQPGRPPVLSGQRWLMPGLGPILIVETLSPGSSFAPGSRSDVRYRMADGSCGLCTKNEIRSSGKLMPYSHQSQKDQYIEEILNAAKEKKNDKWEPYSPPKGWTKKRSEGKIVDAEIIDQDQPISRHPFAPGYWRK